MKAQDESSTLPSPLEERFLIVGEGSWTWYEEACADALRSLGIHAVTFAWAPNFMSSAPDNPAPIPRSQRHRVELKLGTGPSTIAMNRELIRAVREHRPSNILFYNARLIYPGTIRRIQSIVPRAVIGHYVNDDPFSPSATPGYWRHVLRSIPYFDLVLAFRPSNIEEFRRIGAQEVVLLRPYYVPQLHFPLERSQVPQQFHTDVVFAGHYEDDGRLEALEAVAAGGYRLRIFGGNWAAALRRLSAASPLREAFPTEPAIGSDYRNAVCGSKVALCFLSQLNRDVYTTRNFEVPAMGVPLLSQYSADLATMFREGEEMEFFRNRREFVIKIDRLINDPIHRERIAAGGLARVTNDHHDVVHRMSEVVHAFRGKTS